MTDHTDSVLDDMEDMDDIELITRLLNGQLEPDRAAAVKLRLKEDPAFLELAAPLLLAWEVPPHIERKPRPEGEKERAWAEFVKRTGFPLRPQEPPAPAAPPERPRQRHRSWLRWLAVAVLGVAGVAAIAVLVPRRASVASDPASTLVPYDTGWIALNDGIEVQLSPGASLRAAHRRLRGMRHLLLDGTARFRVTEVASPQTSLRTAALVVETSVGFVIADESEFSVTARADTTEVHVYSLPRHGLIPPTEIVLTSVIEIEDLGQILGLHERDRARLVRGHDPERIISTR